MEMLQAMIYLYIKYITIYIIIVTPEFCPEFLGVADFGSVPKFPFLFFPNLQVLGSMLGQVLREPEAKVEVRLNRGPIFSRCSQHRGCRFVPDTVSETIRHRWYLL